MIQPDPTIAADIAPGLVLHLDPAVLAQHGATPSPASEKIVIGPHFFLCYAVDGGRSWWTPLYTKPSAVRHDLSRWGRVGHEKWTGGAFNFHPEQHWIADANAIALAARAGRDRSRSGARNRMAVEQLPRMPTLAVGP